MNGWRTIHIHPAIFLAVAMSVQGCAWTLAESGDGCLPVHRADDAGGDLSGVNHWALNIGHYSLIIETGGEDAVLICG
jgi:hypothetical protein